MNPNVDDRDELLRKLAIVTGTRDTLIAELQVLRENLRTWCKDAGGTEAIIAEQMSHLKSDRLQIRGWINED